MIIVEEFIYYRFERRVQNTAEKWGLRTGLLHGVEWRSRLPQFLARIQGEIKAETESINRKVDGEKSRSEQLSKALESAQQDVFLNLRGQEQQAQNLRQSRPCESQGTRRRGVVGDRADLDLEFDVVREGEHPGGAAGYFDPGLDVRPGTTPFDGRWPKLAAQCAH